MSYLAISLLVGRQDLVVVENGPQSPYEAAVGPRAPQERGMWPPRLRERPRRHDLFDIDLLFIFFVFFPARLRTGPNI